jgi:hypothetical protein
MFANTSKTPMEGWDRVRVSDGLGVLRNPKPSETITQRWTKWTMVLVTFANQLLWFFLTSKTLKLQTEL